MGIKSKRKTSKFVHCLLVLCLMVNALACCPSAQAIGSLGDLGLDAIAIEIGRRTVKSLIEDLRVAGQKLISEAGTQGNALLSRFGNEANVLADNATLVLHDELNKRFDQLSKSEGRFLAELERFRRDLNGNVNKAYDMKDTLALDLSDIASKLPGAKNQTFFVQRVDGLSILPGDSTYKITVVGSKLGIAQDRTVRAEVFLDAETPDNKVKDLRTSNSTNHKLDLFIEGANFHFNEQKLLIKKCIVKIMIKEGLARQRTYKFPIYLSLFPTLAATITFQVTTPKYGWVETGLTKEDTKTTGNHHTDSSDIPHYHYDLAILAPLELRDGKILPGSQRLSNARLTNIGGNPGFYHINTCEIQNSGSRAYAEWEVWSTPSVFKLSADLSQWVRVGEEHPSIPAAQLYFDKVTYVPLPSNYESIVITVKPFVGKEYDFVPNKFDDPTGLIRFIGDIGDSGSEKRVAFGINRPNQLNPFNNALMARPLH